MPNAKISGLSPPGSIWIKVDVTGKAACPHCEKLSWISGEKWGGGCAHVVGPGKDNDKPAIIFKGEK